MKLLAALLPAALLLAAGGCSGGGGDVPTPRRTAYPRIEAYPATYGDASATLPVVMLLNDSARVAVSEHGREATWVDAVYPRYGGAVLRLTVSRLDGDALLQAIANRRERMVLNAGGLPTVVTTLTAPGGLSSEMLTTPAAAVTPLQIVATDSASLLIAGALELPRPDGQNVEQSAEYYAPVVTAVERDLLHMAKHLEAR